MDKIQQCHFEKINKFLFIRIFDYINKPIANIHFELKLFQYSKLYQKKYGIDLNDYKYIYFYMKFYDFFFIANLRIMH